ncbi:MAG: hypothetical protein V4507_03925 [Verrucomicrobiota bacterium]
MGHDHNNDYAAMLHGIALTYGRSMGLDSYGDLGPGSRIIELTQNRLDFESWIHDENSPRSSAFFYSELLDLSVKKPSVS